jgi:hypothetical protein
MARLQNFLERYKTTVNKQVDITSADLLARTNWLTPYAPFATYPDYDLMVLKARQNRSIANLVGFEGEIPASRNGDLSVVEGGMIKIAKSHVYTEEDMKLMRKWEQNITGVPNTIKDFFFGTVTQLPQMITDTHTLLTTQGLSMGAIDFIDQITGIKAEVIYTADSDQYPAALAGGAQWNVSATGTPIQNLIVHSRYYRRRVGRPLITVMNEATYDEMVDTVEFRTQVAAFRNVDASSVGNFKVSEEDAAEIFRKNKIPTLMVVDETYEEAMPDGSRVEKPFVEDGRYFFLWNNNAERALGPVESNNGIPGIYTFTEEVSKEPPVDRSVGVATGTPLIFDTRKMGGRKVS